MTYIPFFVERTPGLGDETTELRNQNHSKRFERMAIEMPQVQVSLHVSCLFPQTKGLDVFSFYVKCQIV